MIFVDTSFFYPLFSEDDVDHTRVREVFEAYRGRRLADLFLTTNYVVSETITLIRTTPPRSHAAAVKAGERLFSGKPQRDDPSMIERLPLKNLVTWQIFIRTGVCGGSGKCVGGMDDGNVCTDNNDRAVSDKYDLATKPDREAIDFRSHHRLCCDLPGERLLDLDLVLGIPENVDPPRTADRRRHRHVRQAAGSGGMRAAKPQLRIDIHSNCCLGPEALNLLVSAPTPFNNAESGSSGVRPRRTPTANGLLHSAQGVAFARVR